MNRVTKVLKLSVVVGAMSLGYSGSAQAVCCYVPMEIVASAISSSTATISGAIGASASSIVGAIQYATQSPTSMLLQEIQAAGGKSAAATKVLMEAQAALAKAQSDAAHNQTQDVAADAIKVQAYNNSRPTQGCSALRAVVASRVGKAGGAAAGGGTAVNRKVLERLTTTTSPQAAASDVVKNHQANYCSSENASRGRCGNGGAATAEYQNADISAGAFFNGANPDNKTTLTFNDKQKKAAEDFARNIAATAPEPRLDPSTEKTPQGQAYVALHNATSAKKSVVAKFFTDHIAARDGALIASSGLKTVAEGARLNAKNWGYEPDGLPASGQPISYAQILELEANHRYMGKKFKEKVEGSDNEAQLLKYLVEMQAFQLHMQYLQMKQMDEMRAVMSVAANELVEMNSAPKLAAQREAAVRSLR